MDDKYNELRACIYTSESEMKRFRELVVDAVLATDIADKELQTLRKNQWADAFHETLSPGTDDSLAMDRKATIVFEHIPPWVGWYKGELWFFDNYIIPLAQKLNDCGVFGVSYHEFLDYALQNCLEWEQKGERIVSQLQTDMLNKYEGAIMEKCWT
jgi:hypothetical protein